MSCKYCTEYEELPELIINCDHIYLTQKGIDLKVEIPQEKIANFEEIIINGIKFTRENKK